MHPLLLAAACITSRSPSVSARRGWWPSTTVMRSAGSDRSPVRPRHATHAVLTVSVKVEQASVDSFHRLRHLLLQRFEPGGPALSAVRRAAVSVAQSFGGQEYGQTRNGVASATPESRAAASDLLRDGALRRCLLWRHPASVQRPELPPRAGWGCDDRTVHNVLPGRRQNQPARSRRVLCFTIAASALVLRGCWIHERG